MVDGASANGFTGSLTQAEIAGLIASVRDGASVPGIVFSDVRGIVAFDVPEGVTVGLPLILGDDLILVQPDGTLLVLGGAVGENLLILVDGFNIPVARYNELAPDEDGWDTLADASEISLVALSGQGEGTRGGSGEEEIVSVGNPLIGLAINPLLPPTEYEFPEFERRDPGDGGIGPPDVSIDLEAPAIIAETDGPVSIRLDDYVEITAQGFDDGERLTEVFVTIDDLPLGTTTTLGTLTSQNGTLRLEFAGTPEEFADLVLTFPTDFSTDNRSDIASGDLTVSVSANSNFGIGSTFEFPLTITVEGDVSFTGPGEVLEVETDDVVLVRPADALLPVATDADGSESVETVDLTLTGLPAGTLVSFDNGNSFSAVTGNLVFTGSLADYEALVVSFPPDFSTENPATQVIGTVTATTDENGVDTRNFEIVIQATPDIVIEVVPVLTGQEDTPGPDGSGVFVDPMIRVRVEDIDGSEDSTIVTLNFSGLPPGTVFSNGIYTEATSTWVGTLAEANAVTFQLPGDYSGTSSWTVRAVNLEGSESAAQELIITPTGDVDITVSELITDETDDPVAVTPSDSWVVGVSDFDPGIPREVIETVTLTLSGLPPGVTTSAAFPNFPGPAPVITYDPTTGGDFTFVGTGDQYELLNLVFPTDYSTESPATPSDVITGTIAATSNEGANGPVPVTLRIRPEGDVEIDVLTPADLMETDAPTTFTLGDYLDPMVTDADGSENFATLELVITGLPNDSAFDLGDVSGLPAGATVTVDTDGTTTLRATFTGATAADDFRAVTVTVPEDFSTANRVDYTPGTTRPIQITATVVTDEDQDTSNDTPTDGQATATADVVIAFEEDIELDVGATVIGEEDGGVVNSSIGVTVALGLSIAVDDRDLSEDPATTAGPFGTLVTIEFFPLEPGTTFNGGSIDPSGVWTGTVAEANALELSFPGDYAGVTQALVTVQTPEGIESDSKLIIITPTSDAVIDGEVIADETDGPVQVLLSDFITVDIVPPGETLYSLDFTLPGLPLLPLAAEAIDISTGLPVGTFTPDPGGQTQTLTLNFLDADQDGLNDATGVRAEDVAIIFPTDFSTTSPPAPLSAEVIVRTLQSGFVTDPVQADISVTVNFEGDVTIDTLGTPVLAETDAPLDLRPSDYLLPRATDLDGSETVQSLTLTFNGLPAGTTFSTGGAFAPSTATLDFIGTLAEYQTLIIRLPADYSTENPATTLTGTLNAATNEGGLATETLDVTITAEGDLALSGPGTVGLNENDPPGSIDTDATTELPVEFRLTDAIDAAATDADGSESIEEVTVNVTGLPDGALLSIDGGTSFSAIVGGTVSLDKISKAAYDDVVIRLPDDFSTESPGSSISGTVLFVTDEAILAGETDTGPNDGVATGAFTVTVAAEGDVVITGVDITEIEDLGVPIPLGLDAFVTDIDLSETMQTLSVTFDGLPNNGPTLLSNGQSLTPASNVWTGSEAELRNLSVISFPEHFSGRITMTVQAITNENGPGGASRSYLLDITPVAEPQITLSIDADGTNTTQIGPKQYATKEDQEAVLRIEAVTADKDGSEALTQVVVENVPSGWLRSGDGAVPAGRITEGAGDIASATVTGTTLTILLNAGVTDFTGAFRLIPEADADQDVSTLAGGDLLATVTSVDTATSLPTDTATASDTVDLDIDAVIDPIDLDTRNRSPDENISDTRRIRLGIEGVALDDNDGSEFIDALDVTISVATLSDNYDPSDTSDLRLFAGGGTAAAIVITQTGSTADSVSYSFTKAPFATDAEFQAALAELRVEVPQHFSGVLTNNGMITWRETTTDDAGTDQEFDTSDNLGQQAFQTRITVDPIAEANLTLTAFVRDGGASDPFDFTDKDVVDGAPASVSGTAGSGESVTIADIMELRESTLDGSGPGTTPETLPDGSINDQVQVYLGLTASTPDTDGSEELETLVISNIPTAWLPTGWQTGSVPASEWGYLRNLAGDAAIDPGELAKIQSIGFDLSTGTLTVTFKDDVTSFTAALALEPTPYEDWDPDQTAPFGVVRPNNATGSRIGTSEGEFFGSDIVAQVSTRDGNTATTDTEFAEVEVDIDVAPINNIAIIVDISKGNEATIDNLPGGPSGIWDAQIFLDLGDKDGSEIVSAMVLRAVPQGISVYVPSTPGDPTSVYVPALITKINLDGSSDWSLENGTWENVQFRGIPLHYAGDFPLTIDIVTTEFDGGGTRVTSYNEILQIDPVADGGNPTGSGGGLEDTPFGVNISANIIDSAALIASRVNDISEEVVDRFRLVSGDFPRDSFGRPFLLFDGPPQIDASSPPDPNDPYSTSGYTNLINPTTWIDWSVVPNLTMLAGLDSNEELTFQIELEYVEVIDTTETKLETGTVSIEVVGVADAPTAEAQQEDPAQTPGGIPISDIGTIDPIYRAASEDTDGAGPEGPSGTLNYNRLYGYAGDDTAPFLLNQRLTDKALTDGYENVDPTEIFQAATPLSGQMTETTAITGGTPFDGSETLYYLITGIPAGASFLGVTPVDPTGETVIVTDVQLANLAFVAPQVDEVTYYDLTFNTIVIEDDVDPATIAAARSPFIDTLTGLLTNVPGFLNRLAQERGAAVTEEQISIVVLPESTGGGDDCPDEKLLPPDIEIVGNGLEDEVTEIKLVLNPNGQYDDILDLINLPPVDNPPVTIQGDLGILLTLPPGSSITADPPGSILYDPVSDGWVLDLDKFLAGNVPGDTESSGTIFYTPPEHQSSPVNPFDPSETFGDADPYDNLPDIEVTTVLNDITCGISTPGTGTTSVFIAPVVDGPTVSVSLVSQGPITDRPTPEDVPINLNVTVDGVDGGERLVPGSAVKITINGSHIGGALSPLDQQLGLQQSGLYDSSGNIIDDARLQIIGGDYVYTLTQTQLPGLYIVPKNHIHGELVVSVEAIAEDIDGSQKSGTGTGRVEIDAIADEPVVDVDETLTDPETGDPVAVIDDGGTPGDPSDDFVVVTAIEDQRIFLQQISPAFTPDMDGSEFLSAVFVPDPNLEIGATSPLTSIIDNGDGTFTIALEDFDKVWLKLKDEHARTPDNLDATIPSQVEVDIRLISYELPNGDEFEFDAKFLIQVRPDADKPTVQVAVVPTTGVEDQPQPYALNLTGSTPDPHESIDFEVAIEVPSGGFDPANEPQFLLDGTPLALQFSNPADPDDPYGGVAHAFVSVPGTFVGSTAVESTFQPDGVLTFVPPQDFGGGQAALKFTAITSDDVPAPWSGDGYVDTERSDTSQVVLDIAVAPDLVFSITDDTVDLTETDAPLVYTPSTDIDIDVTDTDGSEVATITYTLDSVPDGTTYDIGGGPVATAGSLNFTGTLAEFNALAITFPADFATNGTSINGTVQATTNEGGNDSGTFTIDIAGELDLTVTVTPTDAGETGAPVDIPLGIDAQVTDTQATPSETLETVLVNFDAPLPVGTTVSDGTLAADRQSVLLERNGAAPATFAAAVAALTLTLPAGVSGDITGTVDVTTNHGTLAGTAFTATINAAPVVATPLSVTETATSFTLTFAQLTGVATDPDTPLTVENVLAGDPDVTVTVNTGAQTVQIDVPAGYDATSSLTYDIVDSGVGPARTATSASLDIDTLQMVATGTATAPDGITRDVMSDVDGTPGGSDMAKGTSGDDFVTHAGTPDSYADIAGFTMGGGSDYVDLSAASGGFDVDLGPGVDVVVGSTGVDTLSGGLGADIFALLSGFTVADVISDYDESADQIDISAVIQGIDTLTDTEADYDPTTGTLDVQGAPAFEVASLPTSVTVIFEDSSGAAATQVLT